MKPVLKATGAKRLKLKYDEPLSNYASNFNLRRYVAATVDWRRRSDSTHTRRNCAGWR
jgi:hypothetical protein